MITSDIFLADDVEWSRKYNRKFEKFVGYNTNFNLKSKIDVEKALKDVEYITFLSFFTVKSFVNSLENNISCVKSLHHQLLKTLKKFKINIFSEVLYYTADGVINVLRKE